MTQIPASLKLFALLALPVAIAPVVRAQWLATPVNGNFNNANNWTGTVLPGSGTTAQFTLDSSISTITVDTARQNGINITAAGTAFTFTGGSLQLASGQGITASAAVTLNQTFDTPLFVATRTSSATNTMTASGVNSSKLILNGGYSGGVSTAGLSSILSLRGTGYGVSNGVIADGSFGGNTVVTKTGGNTGTWELNGASTYTGGTEFSGGSGTLILGNKAALGTGALRLIGGALSFSANTDLSGSNAVANTINYVSGTTNTTSNASLAFVAASNVATLVTGTTPAVGDIVSTGSAGSLPVYSRVTGVSGNQITFDNAALLTATNTVTAGFFTGSGGSTVTIGGTNNLEFSGTQNLTTTSSTLAAATQTYNVTNTGVTTFSGVLQQQGGAATVTKTGSGTLVLSGANTFSGGLNVNGGTLLLNSQSGSSSGSVAQVIVNTGGTLGGNGRTSSLVLVNSGGTFAVGGAGGTSTGVFTSTSSGTSALVLSSGSFTTFDINGTAKGTSYDNVTSAGRVNYGGAFSLNFGATVSGGTTVYDLFDTTSIGTTDFSSVVVSGLYTGTLNLAGTGATGVWSATIGGISFSFSQSTGDLTLVSAVPEPSTVAMLAGVVVLGAATVCRRRRVSV